MKRKLDIFLRSIYLALLFLLFGTNTVFAQETETPTVTPTPTQEWEPLFVTGTPIPTKNYDCPNATPVNWGLITPEPFWSLMCEHCQLTLTPGPTGTPYPTPQNTMTVYPTSTPTLTPTPTPDATLYRVKTLDAWGYWFNGSFYISNYYLNTIVNGNQPVHSPFELVINNTCSNNETYDRNNIECGYNNLVFEKSTNGGATWTEVAGNGDHQIVTSLWTSKPSSYFKCSYWYNVVNANDCYGVWHQGMYKNRTADVDFPNNTANRLDMTWHIYVNINAAEIPSATPTPQTTSSSYCASLDPFSETDIDRIAKLPSIMVKDGDCYGIPEIEFPAAITDAINSIFDDPVIPEGAMILPGGQICIKPISFGTVSFLGTEIDLDLMASIISGIVLLFIIIRM